MSKKAYCPECQDNVSCVSTTISEKLTVRGELIAVSYAGIKCSDCGCTFEDESYSYVDGKFNFTSDPVSQALTIRAKK